MAKQVTINDSFYKKLGRIKELAEEEVKLRAKDIVDYAVDISPVDTGAYVESFSVVPRGAGGGRMRSSKGRPRKQNRQAVQEQEKARLSQEIDTLDIAEAGGFTLRNRAPHANDVEYGENWIRDGYYVFTQTRDRFR